MARRQWKFEVQAIYRDRSFEDFCREEPAKAKQAGLALWEMFASFREVNAAKTADAGR